MTDAAPRPIIAAESLAQPVNQRHIILCVAPILQLISLPKIGLLILTKPHNLSVYV